MVKKASLVTGGTLLVGDEMHALGAAKTRNALDESYDMRLGLSATPERWFDDEGTRLLLDYFGGTVYSLPIDLALKTLVPSTGLTLLTPYTYHPIFVSLTEDELEHYQELTTRFARSMSASDTVSEEDAERYLFERAGVVKKAATKLGALESVLGQLDDKVDHCLIYCFDREQMADVEAVLATRPIVYAEFTGDESVRERQRLLRDFDSGDISVLVAMQCLDEGVDVPSARIGVMLASSTNPRESIQRRGRLLRRCPGKARAVIYDVLVRPRPEAIGDARFREIESRLFKKELERLGWFASCADNSAECWTQVIRELRDAS